MSTYYEKNKEKVRMYYQNNREKILKSISDKYDNISVSEYNKLYYLGYRKKKHTITDIKTRKYKIREPIIDEPIKENTCIQPIYIHDLLEF